MFPQLIHLRAFDTCAVAFFLFAILLAPSDVHAVVPFEYPLVDSMPMDGCLDFATDCEQTAADHFCQIRGYTDAGGWKTENSPSDTKTLKTKRICDTSQWICARFSFIDCEIDNTITLLPDDALAHQYAPILRLSGPEGVGVALHTDHPYTDYIPLDIHDITSHPTNKATFVRKLKDGLFLEDPLDNRYLDEIGGPPYNENAGQGIFGQSANYVSLAPVWKDGDKEGEYKQLHHSPAVYYRVSRADPSIRLNPIAIQYWFFYFYNNWSYPGDHPGDWETITIFLNVNEEPVEAVYSTHHEANRHSWGHIIKEASTHPVVFVSNGGHGSYNHAGRTPYAVAGYTNNQGDYKEVIISGYTDNHWGDKEVLFSSGVRADDFVNLTPYNLLNLTPYNLINLEPLEKWNSWLWFPGRWGGEDDHVPQGPAFRTDVPTQFLYNIAKHPPCHGRLATNIYFSPWLWADGYPLDGGACPPPPG